MVMRVSKLGLKCVRNGLFVESGTTYPVVDIGLHITNKVDDIRTFVINDGVEYNCWRVRNHVNYVSRNCGAKFELVIL